MAFKYYSVDNAVWEDYFVRQAKSGKMNKKIIQSGIYNDLDSDNEYNKLAVVGKTNNSSAHHDPVIVKVTSPASATLEMAKAEIDNIKEHEKGNSTILSPPVKRKRGITSKKSHTVKRKYSNRHQDIFSQ